MEPTQGTSPHGEPTRYYGNQRHAVFADPLRNSYFLLKSAERRNLLYVVVVAICVICTVLVATTWNYKTYVVRVDNATGRIETGGQLKATNYSDGSSRVETELEQGGSFLDERSVNETCDLCSEG